MVCHFLDYFLAKGSDFLDPLLSAWLPLVIKQKDSIYVYIPIILCSLTLTKEKC